MSAPNPPRPDLDDASAQAIMDAMAPFLGFVIDPEFRDGVVLNLKVTSRLADIVLTFPLADEREPAPVFRP